MSHISRFLPFRNTLARWYISRALDTARPVPHWWREVIDQTPELREFEMRARQLNQRLIQDASTWTAASVPEGGRAGATEPAETSRLVTLRVDKQLKRKRAARDFSSHAQPTDRRPILGAVVAAAILSGLLISFWRGSHSHSDAVSRELGQRAVSGAPEARPPIEPAVPVPAGAADRAESPLDQVQVALAQSWSVLDEAVEQQRCEISTNVRAAVSFFARELPSSAARLVGWDPNQARRQAAAVPAAEG